MEKQHYTFIINGILNNKIHNYISNSPKNACMKVVNRILRDTDEQLVNLNVTIINLVTNKKYYYKIIASKNETPVYKRINDFKTISLRYRVFIQKVPTDLIEYLQK